MRLNQALMERGFENRSTPVGYQVAYCTHFTFTQTHPQHPQSTSRIEICCLWKGIASVAITITVAIITVLKYSKYISIFVI